MSKALFQHFSLTPGAPLTFDQNGRMVSSTVAASASADYDKLTDGAQSLVAANAATRAVTIVVEIIETFAAGNGTKPAFAIGEDDTPNKFVATLDTGTAGDKLTYAGTLTAGKALLVTGTAGTGTTETGAIRVTALALPASV